MLALFMFALGQLEFFSDRLPDIRASRKALSGPPCAPCRISTNSPRINTSKISPHFHMLLKFKDLNPTRINTSGDKDLMSLIINTSGNKDLMCPVINT
jgi:hypothetical protein